MTIKAENNMTSFRVINIYKLYNHIQNNSAFMRYEVVSNEVSKDLDNDFFQNLSFYSSKTQDEIDFEVFSTFATLTYRDRCDIFRMSKDYNNAEEIQDYFYKKYGIKYFNDIVIEQNPDLPFTDWIFNRNHVITLEDFVQIIKPNFRHSFTEIVESDEALFNWDFFMSYEKLNAENPIIKYYIYSDLDYYSLKNNSEDAAKNIFKLISDNNSYSDIVLSGLLIDKKQTSDKFIDKYFTVRLINGNDTVVYMEPKFVEGIDSFIKENSISTSVLHRDAIRLNEKLNVLILKQ